MILIICPNVYFNWARGANARGTTQERGEALLRRLSPLSLRFSLSRSPFPDSLLSESPPLTFSVLPKNQLRKWSAEQGDQGVRKAGARGRKPRGIGGISRLRRIPLFPWVVTPVPLGEVTLVFIRALLGSILRNGAFVLGSLQFLVLNHLSGC